MRKLILWPMCLLFLFAFFPLFPQINFWSPLPPEELIDEIAGAMSDEELLGQVFILGYIGTELSSDAKEWIEKRHAGGIKIFPRNVKNLKVLAGNVKEMQLLATANSYQIPLFVATDQEGGWVRHIKHETSETPGNLALGASGIPYDAYLTG